MNQMAVLKKGRSGQTVPPRKLPGTMGNVSPPMPDYSARILGYMLFVGIIVSGIVLEHFDKRLVWLVPVAMLWPHLLYFGMRYWHVHGNLSIRQRVLYFDCLLTGFILNLLQFSVTPSLAILIMVYFSLIIVGGLTAFFVGNLALLAGLTVSSLTLGLSLAPMTPPLLTLASILFAALFVCISAHYIHLQSRALMLAKTEIQMQREQSIALSHKLAKYLSPQVWQSIFTGERDVKLETQRKKLTVFFSDIKGFTELSEEIQAESLTDLLNTYFNEMAQIALKFGGTIDKFVGDSIMIFFGDPTSRGSKEDSLACVSMAIEMRKRMKVLRQKWRSTGVRAPLEVRMGVSTGFCTVGNFGSENRMDYTIIGKEVNLASRLESLAEPGEILVGFETFSLIKDMILCRDKGEIVVKGFNKPVPIYSVVDFRRDMGRNQSFLEQEAEGFAMYMDSSKIGEDDRQRIQQSLEKALEKLRDVT
tara:strand:+ start:72281 stop:73708 length:1428 start_codon:yes stop_codon:yes gene_type:complete